MLIRKPTHAGGSPTGSSTRLFTEIDSSLTSFSTGSPPSIHPPANPQSKTHAFFSSPFATAPPSPLLPPKRLATEDRSAPIPIRERASPSRSLTADFFSENSSVPLSKAPTPSSAARRNFLHLELNGDGVNLLKPIALSGAFASTPTPTEARGEFLEEIDKTPAPSWSEILSHPTPKPPSVVLNHYLDTLPSAPSITNLGTEPDAEVLSTSPSFSHLSVLGSTAAQGLSTYPSRPTSSLSFHAALSDINPGTSIHDPELNLYPAGDEEELASGMIIRSFLPSSKRRDTTSDKMQAPYSVSAASSNSSNDSTNITASSSSAASIPVTLRLNRPLGQGTFSSVWLAEDLSPTSLLLRSKKSLKDLKRKSTLDLKAKGAGSNGESGNTNIPARRKDGKLKSSLGTTSSLMRRLRGGVSGTRPGGASASSKNKPQASVAIGRHGTLMPSPTSSSTSSFPTSASALSPSLSALGLPPSLIPGHPRSSSSPSTVSIRSLGLGSFSEQERAPSACSGRSIYLEFDDETSEIKSPFLASPPTSPSGYSDTLSSFSLGVSHSTGTSVSRASSISWRSSASSDEGHDGGAGAVQRNDSTRSSFSTRSFQDDSSAVHRNDSTHSSSARSFQDDSSASRRSSTRSSVVRGRSKLRSRLVAVKLTSRGIIEERERVPGQVLTKKEQSEEEERTRERDRTRVSFVREVEVLKHISHPNITPLLSHLTTRTHHVLVLPYLPGGDLLGLVNDETAWNCLGETTIQRIFSELCKAVGWMHSVGLVHRDIKLENILLTVSLSRTPSIDTPDSGSTANGVSSMEGVTMSSSPRSYIFSGTPSSPASYTHDQLIPPIYANTSTEFPVPPQPLIKLTDFGLSRFIDSANPLLTTRCGSEAYAAPELVIGGGRAGVASSPKSPWFTEDRAAGYAHENDFESENAGGYDARETDAWACGVVLYALVVGRLPFGEGPGEALAKISGEGGATRGFSPMERRQWLMKIARGEWHWPESDDVSKDTPDSGELLGSRLVRSTGAKRVVEKLLVRDPSRRARVKDLWSDEWVNGGGAPASPRINGNNVERLSMGSDYSSFTRLYDQPAPVSSPLPSSVDFSSSDMLSISPPNSWKGSAFGDNISFLNAAGGSYDDEEFDNDRRENQVVPDREADESRVTDEDDLEDELEEEDQEGWLVDKDGINNIARSEVPR